VREAVAPRLDERPRPCYSELPMALYWQQTFGPHRRYMMVRASQGCPHSCVFCPYPFGVGGRLELREPESVVAEIRWLRDAHGVEAIHFRDQLFAADRDQAVAICEGLLTAGLDLPWICETRLDAVDPELLRLMARAGCVRLEYGVETADEELFRSRAKPGSRVGLDGVGRVLRQTEKAGIAAHLFLLLGFPEDSRATIAELRRRLREWRPLSARITAIKPYPGTPFYEQAQAEGLLVSGRWSDYVGDRVLVRTRHLAAEELERAIQELQVEHERQVRWRRRLRLARRGVAYLRDGTLAARLARRLRARRR